MVGELIIIKFISNSILQLQKRKNADQRKQFWSDFMLFVSCDFYESRFGFPLHWGNVFRLLDSLVKELHLRKKTIRIHNKIQHILQKQGRSWQHKQQKIRLLTWYLLAMDGQDWLRTHKYNFYDKLDLVRI